MTWATWLKIAVLVSALTALGTGWLHAQLITGSLPVAALSGCATAGTVPQGGAPPACTATPTLTSLTLSGLTANRGVVAGAAGLLQSVTAVTNGVLVSGAPPTFSATPTLTSLTLSAPAPFDAITFTNATTGDVAVRLQAAADNSLNLVPRAGNSNTVFRVFGTENLVSGGDFVRVDLRHNGTNSFLLTEASGALPVGDLGLGREGPDGANTTDWWFGGAGANAGHFFPNTSNTRDVGTATFRARTLYLATGVNHLVGAGTNTQAMVGRLTGTLAPSTTAVGNTGVGEDDLLNAAFEASSLSAAGKSLHLVVMGTTAANANNKRIRAYFGASLVFDSGIQTSSGLDWKLTMDLIAATGTSQKAITRLEWGNAGAGSGTTYTSPAETATGAITVRVTAEAVATNDVVLQARTAFFGN